MTVWQIDGDFLEMRFFFGDIYAFFSGKCVLAQTMVALKEFLFSGLTPVREPREEETKWIIYSMHVIVLKSQNVTETDQDRVTLW